MPEKVVRFRKQALYGQLTIVYCPRSPGSPVIPTFQSHRFFMHAIERANRYLMPRPARIEQTSGSASASRMRSTTPTAARRRLVAAPPANGSMNSFGRAIGPLHAPTNSATRFASRAFAPALPQWRLVAHLAVEESANSPTSSRPRGVCSIHAGAESACRSAAEVGTAPPSQSRRPSLP